MGFYGTVFLFIIFTKISMLGHFSMDDVDRTAPTVEGTAVDREAITIDSQDSDKVDRDGTTQGL